MRNWFQTLPVTVKLPLLAAVMILVAAVVSTQTAIHVLTRQADRQVETLGQVYLDGLSAALLPGVLSDDREAIRAALERALSFHQGVVDRRLAYIDAEGTFTVDVSRPELTQDGNGPTGIVNAPQGMVGDADGSVWIWRELVAEGATRGVVVANLDTAAFVSERTVLRWGLLGFDLLFSGICALLGFFMIRRVQAPVAVVAHHLYDAALGMLRPIDKASLPQVDPQTERMVDGYNAMANATVERENLLNHMADQQREADLGRLTATIAHEVRNPLGGMRTAISTLKRFGERAQTREEAVQFLERGVLALQEVVDATLESFRGRRDWRPLSRKDFDDLKRLVEPDGRTRDVVIEMDVSVPQEVPVAALEVRQVLLNLLLNAIRASLPGGSVALAAHIEDGELVVTVTDQGTGMTPAVANALSGGVAERGPGLGVAVVIQLVKRLNGRVSIESGEGAGTAITLHFPLDETKSLA